jgi:hypothetical protein
MLRKNLCTAASETNAAPAQPFGGPPLGLSGYGVYVYGNDAYAPDGSYDTYKYSSARHAYRRIVVCGPTLSDRGEAGRRRQPARCPR